MPWFIKPWKQHVEDNLLLVVHLKNLNQPHRAGKPPGWHEEGNLSSASRSLGDPPRRHQKSLTSIPGAVCTLNCEHRINRAKQGKSSLSLKPKVKEEPSSWWPLQPTLTFFLSLKFACMIFLCKKIWHSYIQPLPKCVPCSSLCFSQHNHCNLILHN